MIPANRIYLDNASTTRPFPEVRSAVLSAMDEGFGNASSRHSIGLAAAREIQLASERILALVGSGAWKVLFTSGGTEGLNLAIKGSVPRGPRNQIVTSSVEHAATAESCAALDASGCSTVVVKAGMSGVIDPAEVGAAVTDRTALVTITGVANEMGTVQPANDIAAHAKAANGRLRVHVDAVQALAQLSRLDYSSDVDMVSISSHKIHGPQGVGALLIRPGISLRPLFHGGDQQNGIRPGTFNLPGIVGFGTAAMYTGKLRDDGVPRMRTLREQLVSGLCSQPGVRALGDATHAAAGLAVIAVAGIPSEVFLHGLELRGVIASAGSACHASRRDPPGCLIDAGLKPSEGTIRFSLSFENTSQEVEACIRAFHDTARAIRNGNTGELL